MGHTLTVNFDIDLKFDQVEVTVDGIPVPAMFDNCSMTVEFVDSGLHYFKVTSLTDQAFCVKQVLVDSCDIRKYIYLSWLVDCQGHRHQPATAVWERRQSWILPIGCPLSYWIATTNKKIKNKLYGQDLSEHYHLYYPDSQIITHPNIPKIIKDFYQYNFDFVAVPRQGLDLTQIPFMHYKKQIPSQLMQAVVNEVHDHIDDVHTTPYVASSVAQNQEEFKNISQDRSWQVLWLLRHQAKDMSITTSIMQQFPAIQQLIDFLGLKVFHVFIANLPPGQFIYPHVDDESVLETNYLDYRGCTQLYIPIDWPKGASIKFAGAGTVDLAHGPVVINPDHFTHAAVNVSQQQRLVLAIRTDQNILNDCELD
jgi:hypothetical protein